MKPLPADGHFQALQARFEAAAPTDQIVMSKQARADIIAILDACTCLLPYWVNGITYNGHTADCGALPVMESIRARGGFT